MSSRLERHILVVLLGGVLCAPLAAQAGLFDDVVDRAVGSTERKATERVNRTVDQAIDKSMNETEEAIRCAASDKKCIDEAKQQGKSVGSVPAPADDAMKCVATDTACLKQAKAQGKKVEVVDEAELDTLRCTISDSACLQRAKTMGKKVEIID